MGCFALGGASGGRNEAVIRSGVIDAWRQRGRTGRGSGDDNVCVKVRLALELLGLEAALNRAGLGTSMVASATAQDALEHTGALASDGMGALALTVMGIRQMSSTALEAGDKRGWLLAGASSVANVVAAATLAEDRGVTGDIHAAMGAKHADTVATEEGVEGTVAVEEDNRDGSVGQSVEALGAE